jgi:hypothetical protein
MKACTLRVDRSNFVRWKREITNGLRMTRIENVMNFNLPKLKEDDPEYDT